MMCLLHSCMIPLHCFLLSNSLIPQYVLYSFDFLLCPQVSCCYLLVPSSLDEGSQWRKQSVSTARVDIWLRR